MAYSPDSTARAGAASRGRVRRNPRQEPPEIGRLIGDRVHEIRKSRAITLEALARATGFTRGYLSKIENSRKVPPIGSLARIAQALDVDIGAFFQPADQAGADAKVTVVRANERRRVTRGGSAFGYDYESVAYRKRHKHMEPFIFTYPPNLSRDVRFEHEGEELVFVLSGRVEFEAAGDKFILEPGDTLYLESDVPHRARSLRGEAKAFVVIFKPDRPAVPNAAPTRRRNGSR